MEPGFYAINAVNAPVGVGVTNSMFCEMAGILKVNSPAFPYTVANEYVAGRLAQLLALPVPPGTVVETPTGELGYAMMKFGLASESPPPTDVANFVQTRPGIAAGVVLFDGWILNADRHGGNMAWVPPNRDLISVFDHGHALMGPTPGGAEVRLMALQSDPHLGHGAVIGELASGKDVESWVERIQQVRDEDIKEICRPLLSLKLCTKTERDTLIDVLISRAKAMRSMVVASRDKFVNITDDDWGLS